MSSGACGGNGGGYVSMSMRTKGAYASMRSRRRSSLSTAPPLVQAGFHPELLPDWGGKAGDVLTQPKCWSSKTVTASVRAAEHVRVEKARAAARARDLREQDAPTADLRASSAAAAAGGGPSIMQGGGPAGDTKSSTAVVLFAEKERVEEAESRETEIRPLSLERRKAGGACPQQRVMDACERYRNDPEEFAALLERIRQLKDKQRANSRGRNVLVENKWLCDDRAACRKYWEDIDALRATIRNTESLDAKIGLYTLWPHPPHENHSRDENIAKLQRRGAARTERIAQVRAKNAEQLRDRMLRLSYLINKKEVDAEAKRREEHATRIYGTLFPIVLACNASVAICNKLDEVRLETEEQKRRLKSAAVIQRRWKKNRATQSGLQFRNAIKVMRRFARIAAEHRRVDRRQQSANIMLWFLTAFENSNFQKVMRNYRFRVVNCQRFYRAYVEATRMRLKVLGLKWDAVERDMIKQERREARKATPPANEARPILKRGSTIGRASIHDAEPRPPPKRGSQITVGPPPAGARPKQGRASLVLVRRESMAQQTHEQQRREGKRSSQIKAMSADIEADVRAHVHKKVPKTIKRELLRVHLAKARQSFKAQWEDFARARKYMEAQSRLMTIEDVRAVMRADTHEDALALLKKSGADRRSGLSQPELRLFARTTNQVMMGMIRRGRRMAEEHALDALGEELAEMQDEMHDEVGDLPAP